MVGRTPYDSIANFVAAQDRPSWASIDDQVRVASYGIYEDIYWSRPETFKLVARGSENSPIYIPSAKTIIEACNRFLAVGFDYSVTAGDSDKAIITRQFDRLFRREQFYAKFTSLKRKGLIGGDAMWHIVGDGTKPAGTRISMYELDPGTYFPISADDDIERVIGCHIVKQVHDPKNPSAILIRRQTYRKVFTPGGTQITSELAYFEPTGWDDRINPNTLKTYQDLKPVTYAATDPSLAPHPPLALNPLIQNLPVYHIRNQRMGGNIFGSSEIRGLERVAAAVNQSISDEELALALEGLGLYATTSGPPTDDKGVALNWILGPGRVVELNGGGEKGVDFKRVNGVGSVTPSQDHVSFLLNQMHQSSGTPDIAIGIVDVSAAESGIALALKMAPLLAKNFEKETEMVSVYDHLFYDLMKAWLPVYEGLTAPDGVDISPIVGDPMPVDRAATIAEAQSLLTAGLWTIEQAQEFLHSKLGISFELSDPTKIIAQANELSAARDPFGARLNSEIDIDSTDPNAQAGAA